MKRRGIDADKWERGLDVADEQKREFSSICNKLTAFGRSDYRSGTLSGYLSDIFLFLKSEIASFVEKKEIQDKIYPWFFANHAVELANLKRALKASTNEGFSFITGELALLSFGTKVSDEICKVLVDKAISCLESPDLNSYTLGDIIFNLSKLNISKSDFLKQERDIIGESINRVLGRDSCGDDSIKILEIMVGLLNMGLVGKVTINDSARKNMQKILLATTEANVVRAAARFNLYHQEIRQKGFFRKGFISELNGVRENNLYNCSVSPMEQHFLRCCSHKLEGYSILEERSLKYHNVEVLKPDFILKRGNKKIYIEIDGARSHYIKREGEEPYLNQSTQVRNRLYRHFMRQDRRNNIDSELRTFSYVNFNKEVKNFVKELQESEPLRSQKRSRTARDDSQFSSSFSEREVKKSKAEDTGRKDRSYTI